MEYDEFKYDLKKDIEEFEKKHGPVKFVERIAKEYKVKNNKVVELRFE